MKLHTLMLAIGLSSLSFACTGVTIEDLDKIDADDEVVDGDADTDADTDADADADADADSDADTDSAHTGATSGTGG